MQSIPYYKTKHQRQRGVALFIVIVFVMLSMLLALWASRTAWFNELIVGNNADYQRAFEATQALLQDAELDIRGEAPNGAPCTAQPCRAFMPSALQFPSESKEINPLITTLDGKSTKCQDGLCTRRTGRQDFWNYAKEDTPINPAANTALGEVPLSALMAVGARYGQFTGAQLGTSEAPANPILADRTDGQGGWYWIEVMPYSEKAKTANLIVDTSTNQLALNLDVYVVYRITALAYGRKRNENGEPATMAVLQETYARQRRKD